MFKVVRKKKFWILFSPKMKKSLPEPGVFKGV